MNLISSPKMIRPFPNFSLSFYLFFACIVLSLSRDSAPSRGRANLTRVFGHDDLLSLSLFLLFLLFSEIRSHDRTYRRFISLCSAYLLCYLSFHSSYRHFETRFLLLDKKTRNYKTKSPYISNNSSINSISPIKTSTSTFFVTSLRASISRRSTSSGDIVVADPSSPTAFAFPFPFAVFFAFASTCDGPATSSFLSSRTSAPLVALFGRVGTGDAATFPSSTTIGATTRK
jgi:hypothetical protein